MRRLYQAVVYLLYQFYNLTEDKRLKHLSVLRLRRSKIINTIPLNILGFFSPKTIHLFLPPPFIQ